MDHNWQLSEDAYDLLLQKIIKVENLLEKQNGRVGKLEAWRNMLIGAWVLAMLVFSWLKG